MREMREMSEMSDESESGGFGHPLSTATVIDHDVDGGKSATRAIKPTPLPDRLRKLSCRECRRRKVKCNRRHPCTNCVKAESQCVFPETRRCPVRPKKSKAQSDEPVASFSKPQALDNLSATPEYRRRERKNVSAATPSKVLLDDLTTNEDPARLVIDQDRSMYISNSFWANMSREIEEMHHVLSGASSDHDEEAERGERNAEEEGDGGSGQGDREGEEEQDEAQKEETELAERSRRPRVLHPSSQSFVFGPMSWTMTLGYCYPTSTQLLTLFDIFLDNVDPVLKIFHRPTLRSTILGALPRLPEIAKTTEVLMKLLGEEKTKMLARYRFATEQSLARARFLESQSLTILASLVLFLFCVRRHDHSRLVSALLGVAIRNAQAMGLHRDGTRFRLSPFETEMRRRLWWHICVLDLRSSEDNGSEPTIFDNYDTEFPSNINDAELSPEDTDAKPERTGYTDMTFCLVRFEVTIAIRKLHYHAPIGGRGADLTMAQRQQMVQSIEDRFYDRYIKHCDITQPVDWVSATWARLMLAKMWLAASYRSLFKNGGCDPNIADSRHFVFGKAVEVLELSDLLETSQRASRWLWLFLTHSQWHAVAFVLAYLCERPDDAISTRAWLVVERVYERWSTDMRAEKGMLWEPLQRLLHNANRVRTKESSRSQLTRRPSYNDSRAGPAEYPVRTDNPLLEPLPTAHPELWNNQNGTRNRGAIVLHSAPSSSRLHNSSFTQDPAGKNVDVSLPTESMMPDGTSQSLNMHSTSSDLASNSEYFDAQMMWRDWDHTMQDFQANFAMSPVLEPINLSETMPGFGLNFWESI
ncbi:Fungal specific transcription factor domain-containing protein [Cladophialophora immunda]|nr:Fungal specific transcription factor domain-containing protein [Cladophialophora immunda]